MNQTAGLMVKVVRGPDGSPLTIADLPSPDTKRWVIRRKAEVVAAVRGGLLSLDEACSRYALNNDEFLSWQYYLDRYGFAGLRTTKIQSYVRCAQGGDGFEGRTRERIKHTITVTEPNRTRLLEKVTRWSLNDEKTVAGEFARFEAKNANVDVERNFAGGG
jgi:hypothetical protein